MTYFFILLHTLLFKNNTFAYLTIVSNFSISNLYTYTTSYSIYVVTRQIETKKKTSLSSPDGTK